MNTVQQINPCNSQQWLGQFLKHPFYQKIADKYKMHITSYREMSILKASLHHTVYETGRKFLHDYKILDVVPYYYIDFLLQKNPQSILDLGCGLNIFKNHIPGIIGMDADPNSKYDIFDHFDSDFVSGHQEFVDSVISINCIHFNPITTITQQLQWVAELVKPGGRGFVSTNLETWLMCTDKAEIEKLFGQQPRFDDIVAYVNEQMLNTKLNFLVYDWPVLHYTEHSTIRDDYNGNIRLVFEK